MPVSVGVKLEAYCKAILHAHKYPHHQVFGILVGTTDKAGEKVIVEDAFPLFHGSILAPILEAAANMIEEYCQIKGYTIAGVYCANESLDDSKPNNSITKIADKIQETFVNACILMIDNQRLSSNPEKISIEAYVNDSKQWKLNDSVKLEDANTLSILKTQIQEKFYLKLADFENHLDDVSKDWLNSSLINQ